MIKNACTIDTCDDKLGCVFTPLKCEGNNKCFPSSCNPSNGRCQVLAAVNCDDNNACTIDKCDKETGKCQNTPIDCDDNNACTKDSCNKDTGRCIHKYKKCNDDNVCTKDSCNPKTGECVFHDISSRLIGNVDKCTLAVCDAKKGVVKTPVECSTTDKCKKSYCDAKLGCLTVPVTCQKVSHFGSTYSCNADTGRCETKIPTCPVEDADSCYTTKFIAGLGCLRENNCKAPNNCTIASCLNGKCHFRARICDDGNACTEDSCSTDGSCKHTPKVCHGPKGFTSVCNPSTGKCDTSRKCSRNFQCDDKNPATKDICDKERGCIHIIPPPPISPCDDLDSYKIFISIFTEKIIQN